ncbi:MAG: Fis family transcriptional regulator [Myxococcaceae bacterium]
MSQSYSEAELVKNRSAVLLYGGSEADRRAWAEEASAHLAGEGPFFPVTTPEELPKALSSPRGVVYVSNTAQFPLDAQAKILQCLLHQDERPKIIVALPNNPDTAVSNGAFRDDLAYRMRTVRVDLTAPGLKDQLKARRVKQAKLSARPPIASKSRVTIISPKKKPAPAGKRR